MKNSIYFRNFIATALIVLTSFIILGSMFTAWSYRLVLADKREAMHVALEESARSVLAQSQSVRVMFDLSSLEIRMTLTLIARISGFDLLLTDAYGAVVSCSDEESVCGHLWKTIPETDLALVSGNHYSGPTTLSGVFEGRRYVAGRALLVKIDGTPAVYGYLILSSDSGSMVDAWRQFAGVFLLISTLVMCLTFVISFVTTKKQAVPLNEMARAARRFARGDFAVRVEDLGRLDEIGQLTQAFNAMADSLESSEKLRREFIANVSHELKTPMTVIAGFADGILDGTIPPENEARYLGVISSETMRLSRLVKSMLDLSKLQSSDPAALRVSFDAAEVIRLALLSLGGKIDAKELDVDAQLPEEPVYTRGDKDSVTQVVFNLVDNAIKFSARKGVIRVSLWKRSGKAYISVENSGAEIPEDEMPLIFDRFHKADRSRSADREGVGLGLYIVKAILDNHNEDIFVTSRDGVTKFTFTLTVAG